MKKILASFLIFSAMFTGLFFTLPDGAKADCEHYYETVTRDGVRYLIEYSCDGSVVNVTVLED
jgi:hypothetical protein